MLYMIDFYLERYTNTDYLFIYDSQPGLDWSSVKENPTQNWHVFGWLVCLVCIVITWLVSLVVIIRHLRNY